MFDIGHPHKIEDVYPYLLSLAGEDGEPVLEEVAQLASGLFLASLNNKISHFKENNGEQWSDDRINDWTAQTPREEFLRFINDAGAIYTLVAENYLMSNREVIIESAFSSKFVTLETEVTNQNQTINNIHNHIKGMKPFLSNVFSGLIASFVVLFILTLLYISVNIFGDPTGGSADTFFKGLGK